WLPGNLVDSLPTAVPQFWNGQNLNTGVFAKIAGTTYSLLGVPAPPSGIRAASVTRAEYTATHTIFTLTAGSATVRLDFLSPVSPRNYVRQSLPYSYLTVSVSSPTSVSAQVYLDLDESWTGQRGNTRHHLYDTNATTTWEITVAGAATYAQSPQEQALWGRVILSSRPSTTSRLTSSSGRLNDIRSQFITNGRLSGSNPPWATGDVAALSHDLGTTTSSSVTFALGIERDYAINFLGRPRALYYRGYTPAKTCGVCYFLDDFTPANAESRTFDAQIESRASALAGTNYSDVLTLSTRQVYGATDLTIPADTLDTSNVMVFMKEISSDGNVNTIDVIFPAFPIFYVMNPEYIRLLLEPVMQYLATGRWKQPYMIHDIGANYPLAMGHDDQTAEAQPVEECGNIMLLMYAYTQASRNTTFAQTYRNILRPYADYLVTNGLNMSSQISTDDNQAPSANQTSLAIKASIGLVAYGTLLNDPNYTSVGKSYANTLYNQGLATDPAKTHFTLNYPGSSDTFILTYNLYPDVLLKLGTFPQAALDMEAAYYPRVRAAGGVPLSTRTTYGKTDWMNFAAAASPGVNNGTRELLINDVHAYVSNGLNQVPVSDEYTVAGAGVGKNLGFRARPVVGGHFATLAMQGSSLL
ncbi:MAG: hypothetical protein Q9181_007241, partial [Wetmoreana brouardii]